MGDRRLKQRAATRGFTLIEMLVVIAIIAILAGLIVTTLATARKHAAIKRQQAAIDLIEKAYIEHYVTDFSEYPASDGDKEGIQGNELLLKALLTKEKDGPYLHIKEIRTGDSNGNGLKEILDEWGNPLRYQHHRDYGKEPPNKHSFRLWSCGPNGVNEWAEPNSDDIRNWKPGQEEDE